MSMWSLSPTQVSLKPLLFVLLPTAPQFGQSARFSASVRCVCRSRRVGSFTRSSPRRGRPRRLGFGSSAAGAGSFFVGFSRASMSVESRAR